MAETKAGLQTEAETQAELQAEAETKAESRPSLGWLTQRSRVEAKTRRRHRPMLPE